MFKPDDIISNRYKIIERIAFGAFAVVYKAFDQETQNVICIKFEKIEDDVQTMIKHEFDVAKSFNSPFVCKCFDYFEYQNNKAITMELLGENLINVRRKRKNPPSASMLLNITCQCLKALFVLHNNNFIYSDVKPSNFVFRISNDQSNYSLVLLDFGLSQYDGEDPNITKFRDNLVRNPRYLSIHTQETKKWTKTDDIYALIYSMSDFWKNELPWDGRTTNNLVYEIKRDYDLKKLLPPELHVLIENAMLPINSIIQKVEEKLLKIKRNIDEEMHYILDPKDPGLKPKFVKYVFEKEPQTIAKHDHSA